MIVTKIVIAGLVPRLSGSVFVDKVHDVDSFCSRAFGDVSGHGKGSTSCTHKNSVFHDVLKHVRWDEFDRLVEEHGADHRVRRLTTKSQFVALLYGQLAGAASLARDLTGLQSHAARLYHLGACPAQRSTLGRRERRAAERSVHGLVCLDGEAGPSRAAPQDRRDHVSDQFHEPAAQWPVCRLGPLLRRASAAQRCM